MGDALQASLAGGGEHASEVFRRMAEFGRIQADADDPVQEWFGGLQRGEAPSSSERCRRKQRMRPLLTPKRSVRFAASAARDPQ